MRWSTVLLIAGASLAVVILAGSRFRLPSVTVGDEGPTVTPSSAGSP